MQEEESLSLSPGCPLAAGRVAAVLGAALTTPLDEGQELRAGEVRVGGRQVACVGPGGRHWAVPLDALLHCYTNIQVK